MEPMEPTTGRTTGANFRRFSSDRIEAAIAGVGRNETPRPYRWATPPTEYHNQDNRAECQFHRTDQANRDRRNDHRQRMSPQSMELCSG